MKQNVSPVVAAIIIVVAIAALIRFGWKSLGPQHEPVKEPFDMGKMMGKEKMAPPPITGSPSAAPPINQGQTSTPP
jgi:hypothetical protein